MEHFPHSVDCYTFSMYKICAFSVKMCLPGVHSPLSTFLSWGVSAFLVRHMPFLVRRYIPAECSARMDMCPTVNAHLQQKMALSLNGDAHCSYRVCPLFFISRGGMYAHSVRWIPDSGSRY